MNDSFILRRGQDSNLQSFNTRWISNPFDNHCPPFQYYWELPLWDDTSIIFTFLTQLRPNPLILISVKWDFTLSSLQCRLAQPPYHTASVLFYIVTFLITNNKVVFISTPTKNRTWNIGLENRGYIHLTMEATISLGKGYLQSVAESFV